MSKEESTKGSDCAFPAAAQFHTDAGLTKLEYAAIKFMAAQISGRRSMYDSKGEIEESVKLAERLFKRINDGPEVVK